MVFDLRTYKSIRQLFFPVIMFDRKLKVIDE